MKILPILLGFFVGQTIDAQVSTRLEMSGGGYRAELRNYMPLVDDLKAAMTAEDSNKTLSVLDDIRFAVDLAKLQVKGAKQSLSTQEKLFTVAPEAREYVMGGIAVEAERACEYQKAKLYAEEALELGTKGKGGIKLGANIYYGQQVLGLLAMRQGDIKAAKQRLMASAAAPKWPNLARSGPYVLLARRLLDRGEREIVVEFFEQCKRLWPEGEDTLEEWRKEIMAGNVPDFGSRLRLVP